MFSAFRKLCEWWLRIPPEPEPPPGDEAKTQVFRASPNYYWYQLIVGGVAHAITLLSMIVPLVIVALIAKGQEKVWVVAILGTVIVIQFVFLLWHLAILRLNFEKRWYVVTDRSLRVREGVVYVREATITFANIQNISISQGPIQRMLGIADLRVDTAGGGGAVAGSHGTPLSRNLHTAWFRGVNNANEIRELMQQRLRQLKDSGLGDHDELPAPLRIEAPSDRVTSVLREIHAEATALRQAVSQRSAAGEGS